ncbi:hypothetical protein DRO97_05505 [Archaeoglobales archaeon]|nr:MAG: hypothetical protein DRO97_05505 [Archaeoglobales archaeon]
MAKRKTWKEKLEKKMEPKVVDDKKGRGKMFVPTPLLVDELIRSTPRGKLITIAQIREKLAKEYNADLTCPLATGWFIRIAAEAAEEDLRERGKNLAEITPYWRVIKPDGSLNEKFPEKAKLQEERLKEEGFTILRDKKGKLKVKDFEKYLVDLI